MVETTTIPPAVSCHWGVREIIIAFLWVLEDDTEGGTCGIQIRTSPHMPKIHPIFHVSY